MSEINPVATTGTTASTPSTSTTSATNFSEDFDTFLQLLTAQIRNQDPLEPMDSTQFVEQLATFSSLEQQVATNDTLGGIATMIGDLHAVLANEWLGEEVAVSASHVAFEGEPIEFEINPAFSYDEAVLTVTDSQDQIVYQETLDAAAQRHIWDGSVNGQSTIAANGVYELELNLFANGQPIAQTQAEIVSKVTNLGNENGQLRLGTDTYLNANLTDVRKLSSD